MSTEGGKDTLKDWANTTPSAADNNNAKSGNVKKRIPKKFREIPEYYFLDRMSKPKAFLFYGSFIVAGVGTAMLLEGWINNKIKEDGGGVVWEFGK